MENVIFHLTELGKSNEIKAIVQNDPTTIRTPNKVGLNYHA
jgi:hypothetical protein